MRKKEASNWSMSSTKAPYRARLVLDLGVADDFAQASHAGAGDALGHRVPAGLQQLPKSVQVRRPGKPARHADDCYGLATLGRLPAWVGWSISCSFRRLRFHWDAPSEMAVKRR